MIEIGASVRFTKSEWLRNLALEKKHLQYVLAMHERSQCPLRYLYLIIFLSNVCGQNCKEQIEQVWYASSSPHGRRNSNEKFPFLHLYVVHFSMKNALLLLVWFFYSSKCLVVLHSYLTTGCTDRTSLCHESWDNGRVILWWNCLKVSFFSLSTEHALEEWIV